MNWLLPLTIAIFLVARGMSLKLKNPLVNPLIITVAILIPVLLFTQTSYNHFFEDVHIINDLLPYSIVALAYPLYELLPKIKKQWKSLLFITLLACIFSMITGVSIVFWLGGDNAIAASVLSKSVTTAIAVTVTNEQGGIISIAALCVIIAGTLGAAFGHQILHFFNIRSAAAKGLAIGAVAHAVGTAKCIEVDYEESGYSALALVLCGIMTSIISPFLFPLLITMFN